jgi:two-component system cell cycle sensor histidine kinase/response regulator CckA
LVGNSRAAVEQTLAPIRVSVLLIEDNLAEARLLQEILKGSTHGRFSLVHVQRLGEAVQHLQQTDCDVVLLDLTLPDSTGLDSLDGLLRQAPNLPVVVLTNTNDDELAVEAVRHGAQDYLMKRQMNQEVLARSLRYAIERKQAQVALQEANEILEQRVQTRTAELETANQQLRQEIEQRGKIQERLTLAQRVGKIGTFEWHIASDTIVWSAELEALYGLSPGSFDGHFTPWLDRVHADDSDRLYQELQQARQTGQDLSSEFRALHTDGKERWIALKSSLFCDESGQPLRMIGLHLDITEKKRLEEQFLRAQRLEGLGTLASGIAHDLNNILTPILLVVQLLMLKMPELDKPTQNKLKILETSAHRGSALVQQILAFARGVEGKRHTLQVSHLLREVRQLIQQTLPKSIAIETDVDPHLWPISGDATQLHQVFMNLAVNARDAMPDGGTLHIRAENRMLDHQFTHMHLDAQVGPHVVVTVTDTGVGMPPQVRDRIFDPFFTTKAIGKGTGLGLSAVLGIVESHGGFIDVESEVNRGSQFRLYFPATHVENPPPETNLELLSGNQELVLVVDDETAICEITKNTLEAYNYRTMVAHDGLAAIAILAEYKEQVHCVLMDLMMPAMDGLTAIPLLHRLNPDLRVIAMSGLNATETATQARKLGFQGFLLKPFDAQELLQSLRR